MISLLLFGLIASACAAPHVDFNDQQHPHHHHHHHHRHHHGAPTYVSQYHHGYNTDFDNFIDDFEKGMKDFDKDMKDFENEMKKLEEDTIRITHDVSSSDTQESVQDNKYIITINLPGFEHKEIIVKVRACSLTIQAHHENMNYMHFRTLPDTVNTNGTWSYDQRVLKVVFPLKEDVQVQTLKPVTTDSTTEPPSFDREGVVEDQDEQTVSVNQDADVGVNRGDIDAVVQTHEIGDTNTVEATTYAVDLEKEVEFVPVKY